MEVFSPKPRKFYIFLQNKFFLYFTRELSKPGKQKKVHSEEISYISQKKVLLTFWDDY